MTHHSTRIASARVPVACAALLFAAVAMAQTGADTSREPDVWNDPRFQKEVLGSYGVNSDIEPTLTVVDQEILQTRILPLLEANDFDGTIAALEALLDPADEAGEKKKRRRGREAVTAKPSPRFAFMLGNLYFQRDDIDSAASYYARALADFPSYRSAHKNLGIIRVRQGRHQEALRSLSRVVELGGGDGLTYGLLAYAYGATGQQVSAESAYRSAVLLQPDVMDWKLGLTQSVLKQQKYGEAVTLCEELLAREPGRADFWLLQANAHIGLEKPLKAAENFEIVRRMGQATVQSQVTLGDIYVNQSLWDLAADAYAAALRLDPDQDLVRPLRNVEVLAQRGALEQAKKLVTLLREVAGAGLGPQESKKLLKIEARIAVAEGATGDEARILEEIVALDPLDGEALILLGQYYSRTDNPEQAAFYYERASSLEDFEADAKVRHAQLLVGQSKYDEAVPLLKRAQELQPREDVARYLEQVQRVARARR